MAEILPDELLAAAVVDRGVDQVDSPVEHRVQQPACLLVVNRGPPGPAPQLHGPVPEDGHLLSAPPQPARVDRHDGTLCPTAPGTGPEVARRHSALTRASSSLGEPVPRTWGSTPPSGCSRRDQRRFPMCSIRSGRTPSCFRRCDEGCSTLRPLCQVANDNRMAHASPPPPEPPGQSGHPVVVGYLAE